MENTASETQPITIKGIPIGEDVEEVAELLYQGVSVGQIMGMDHDKIEMLYSIAYQCYTAGKYKDARTVFSALCIYEPADLRFWMGLGATEQQLKNFENAAQSYAMACTVTELKDPEPMYFAAKCLLKDGKRDDAIDALDSIEIMGREGNAHDESYKAQAKALLDTLRSEGAGQGA